MTTPLAFCWAVLGVRTGKRLARIMGRRALADIAAVSRFRPSAVDRDNDSEFINPTYSKTYAVVPTVVG